MASKIITKKPSVLDGGVAAHVSNLIKSREIQMHFSLEAGLMLF